MINFSQQPDPDRYASLAVSGVWSLGRLRAARAVVVGAGALGNEVCKNLAMMGVRHITVIDMDTVEVSNLTRSVFFRESDRGRPKAELLAKRIRQVNPDVSVWPIVGQVPDAMGLGVVRRADMVFSCLDNRQARVAINRMCHKVEKPWVDGAMEDLSGEVAVYTARDGPCYECTLTKVDWEILGAATSCKHVALRAGKLGKVPTTSTMGSIVAAIQVQEAIKLHQGDTKGSLAGRKLVINGRLNDFYATSPWRNDECLGHITFGEVTEVPEWTAATTSPQDILNRVKAETGEDGVLRLGFDLATGLRFGSEVVAWEAPCRTPVPYEMASRPGSDEVGEPIVIHRISPNGPFADRPLARLCVPPLDVLEVTVPSGTRWYELTGDLDHLPSAIRSAELPGW